MKSVTLPYSVIQDGYIWSLYSANYVADNKVYGFYFYAITDLHALAIVDDIKDTARMSGKLIEIHKEQI